MIRAGCPRYVCTKCGMPRRKVFCRKDYRKGDSKQAPGCQNIAAFGKGVNPKSMGGGQERTNWLKDHPMILKGYSDCGCGADFAPGIVLDMFAGSCTTAVVAHEHGRDYIMVELSPEYVKLAEKRIAKQTERYCLLD